MARLTCLISAASLLVITASPAVAVPPPLALITPGVSPSVVPQVTGPRSLPRDLVPSLRDADIKPRSSTDGCHARSGDTEAHACIYGVRSSPRTVLLIGDSHAAQWLPALEDLAEQEQWKLYYLTKSACPLPKVAFGDDGCDQWRQNALRVVADLHPDLVIAASRNRTKRMPGDTEAERESAWQAGWETSLRSLRDGARKVVLLGDTPLWAQPAVECLREHRDDIGRCDTERASALLAAGTATERRAAAATGIPFVGTVDLVCRGDPCPAVWGNRLVLYDEQHMTVPWARSIHDDLLARLPWSVLPGN